LMTKKKDDEAMLIRLWNERPADRRTRADLFVFRGEVQARFPALLLGMPGDDYQHLASILAPHMSA